MFLGFDVNIIHSHEKRFYIPKPVYEYIAKRKQEIKKMKLHEFNNGI